MNVAPKENRKDICWLKKKKKKRLFQKMFSKPLFRDSPMKNLVKNYILPTLEPVLPLQYVLTSTAHPASTACANLYSIS